MIAITTSSSISVNPAGRFVPVPDMASSPHGRWKWAHRVY
jgi:hypothetical protein